MSEVTDGDGIPVRWQRWAAVSLMRGTPVTEVLGVLDAEGFDDRAAVVLCASLYESPALAGGRWLAGQLAKVCSVLTMREQLAALGAEPEGIARRSGVSREEFLDRYYARNEPVVLTDVCADWPAVSAWSFEYLADILGSSQAEVATGTESRFMPFAEFAAEAGCRGEAGRAEAGRAEARGHAVAGGNLGLAKDNKLLATEVAAPLWDDFALDERYLEPDPGRTHATLHVGAAGMVTRLRHEPSNVLSCQVDGWQHVIMVPALQIHRVYNSVSGYSDVDPLAPDLARYPLFAGATQFHLDLGPGQALFIPAGWWHHVECTEPSIGISFTNFSFPNEITFQNPEFSL
jgi:hypothetical protein